MKDLFLILFLFTASILHAQDFQTGYIITNNKDTIYGLIDFRSDKTNSEKCIFKSGETAAAQTYFPQDISGYRFTESGRYYVSHDIEIEDVEKKLFLEFMVEGMMNLYFYNDGTNRYFFFEDKDGKITAITQKKTVIDDAKRIEKVDNQYRGILNYTFYDLPEVAKLAYHSDFNQASMIKIARKYHEETCEPGQECIVYENEKPDKTYMKYRISVYGGIRFFNYQLSELPEFGDMKSTGPSLGVRSTLFLPRISSSLGFLFDLSLAKMNINEKYQPHPDWLGNVEYYVFKYNPILGSFKFGGVYQHKLDKIVLNAELAYGFSYLFKEKGYVYHETYNNTTTTEFLNQKPGSAYYLAAGIDYPVMKTHFVFLRATYENSEMLLAKISNNRLKSCGIKAGYTF
ncbi:hypothetical protein [Viscerimonas tarda]